MFAKYHAVGVLLDDCDARLDLVEQRPTDATKQCRFWSRKMHWKNKCDIAELSRNASSNTDEILKLCKELTKHTKAMQKGLDTLTYLHLHSNPDQLLHWLRTSRNPACVAHFTCSNLFLHCLHHFT